MFYIFNDILSVIIDTNNIACEIIRTFVLNRFDTFESSETFKR